MAWVRYDDNFHDHEKVAVVRAGVVEALALHLLANTWTSRSKRPGFVPASIPAVLVGKTKGRRWAAELVQAGLWLEAEGGWEFVNHERYRAPDGRQTPGTPEELSEKRAAAGRLGGAATASKRVASGAANAASVQQTSSKPCSPEPEPVPVLLQAPSRPAGADYSPDFLAFWSAYPRKVEKKNAATAYARARRTVPHDAIMAGVARYCREVAGKDPSFTKHPTSWLNGGCWDDEPARPLAVVADWRSMSEAERQADMQRKRMQARFEATGNEYGTS